MSEYYGIQSPSSDFFMHYGVKGMKWGVRRYIDKKGKITQAAKARYGKNSTKKTSARKMARDFNRLDQSIANKLADMREKELEKLNEEIYSRENNRPINKDYMAKANNKIKEYTKQMLSMANLESLIFDKAKKKGNIIAPVDRYGVSSSQRNLNRVLNVALPIPGLSYGLNKALEKGKLTSEGVHKRVGAEMWSYGSKSKKKRKK